MNELLRLLGLSNTIDTMEPTELATYEAGIRAAAAEVDVATATDEDVSNLLAAADAAEAARTRLNALADEDATRQATIADTLARIQGEDADDEPIAELAGLEGLDEDTIIALSALAPEADPEVLEPETVPELAGLEGLDAATITALHALTASSAPPRVSRVAARRPAQFGATPPPAAPEGFAAWGLTASANSGGDIAAGAPIQTEERLADAFLAAIRANSGFAANKQYVPVVTARREFPTDLRLDEGDKGVNTATLSRVSRMVRDAGGLAAAQALTASGGPCAPPTVNYDVPTLGTDARPVRDQMLVRVGAPRGAYTSLVPPRLTALAGGVSEWDDDANSGAGVATLPSGATQATKPMLRVDCPDDVTTEVKAVTMGLEYGNFRARYFPEEITAWMDLLGVEHSRFAETRMLQQIAALATNTSVNQILGTTRSVLAGLDRAVAGFRGRHRIPRTVPFQWGVPEWLKDNMRTDLARELPGSADERLAMADAQLEQFFRVRNINPIFFLDGETGQAMSGVQNAGAINAWPSTVVSYLYLAGTLFGLDGGELNLGLVRDSSLNGTNDVQFFSETFEAVHFHGTELLRIVFDICPDGATSATVDIDPCTTGS